MTFLLALLLISLLWTTNSNKHNRLHRTELIYIYNSTEWLHITEAPLNPRAHNELMDVVLNAGAGPLVDTSLSLYHTDQYSLFQLIYNRAIKDPRRTMDPSKATSFLIPYDFASDVAFMTKRSGKKTSMDFRRCPLGDQVSSLLRASEWFQRKQGRDHLLMVGMNYAMDHYILKPKCKSFLLACSNCTKLAIDDYSYLYGNPLDGTTVRGDYWHAVPFPSDFHWTTKTKPPFPWENQHRPLLVSYVGSDKSYYGPARKIRQSIISYCNAHPSICQHQTYGANGTRDRTAVDGYNPHAASQASVFCFQPIGDLMTRKGLFDAILMGCIPVTFDVLTATVMYTWHWSELFWKAVSIEMPHNDVAHHHKDPVEYLYHLTQNLSAVIKEKQRLLSSRAFELHYALDGKEEGGVWPKLNGEPMRDAYEIAIDHVLGWHSGKEPDERQGTVPECWGGYVNKTLNKCVPGQCSQEGVQKGECVA